MGFRWSGVQIPPARPNPSSPATLPNGTLGTNDFLRARLLHSRNAAINCRKECLPMRRLAGVISLIVCVSVVGSSARASTKQPWEWTPQERADARRDPAKRLERLRDGRSEPRALGVSAKSMATAADVI